MSTEPAANFRRPLGAREQQEIHETTVRVESLVHVTGRRNRLRTRERLFYPRRACARVTVVVLCVCQSTALICYIVAQLRDKLVILTGSVSWSLQNEFGVFRIMASFRR